MAQDRELTVDQAARQLGVHPNTVRNAIDTGRIRARKVLGRWRIWQSEVERVLEGKPLDEESEDTEE